MMNHTDKWMKGWMGGGMWLWTVIGVGLEAFFRESPGGARRVLRRLADGALGHLQTPELEARAARIARPVERLTGGIVAASFVLGGALLTELPGWHHTVGVTLLVVGSVLAIIIGVGAFRKGRDP